MNSSKRVGRKTVVVVTLAVLLGAAVGLAEVAWEFTPGESGGSSYTQAFNAQYIGEVEGELGVAGAGDGAPEAGVAPYDGLLDNGPARFTPFRSGILTTQALNAQYVGQAEGELEVVGTGAAPYDGMLDNGPARLTP